MGERVRIALPTDSAFDDLVTHIAQGGFDVGEVLDRTVRISNPFDLGFDFEFVSLSSEDVCTYVERGVCNAGIVGTQTLRETGVQVWRPFTFNFGSFPIVLAARHGQTWDRLNKGPILRLATPFPRFTRDWFVNRGVSIDVVQVEEHAGMSVQLGLADAFVDQLTQPEKLVDANFRVVEVLDHTRLKLVVNNALGSKRRRAIGRWIDRLQETLPPDPPPITIPFDVDDPV